MSEDQQGSGGGYISGDPRVSRLINWARNGIAAAFVACIGMAAKNLYDVNVSLVRMIDANVATVMTLKDHEERLRQLERGPRGP
jgi:hypothetical protein